MDKSMQVENEINLLKHKIFSVKHCFLMWQLLKRIIFNKMKYEVLKMQ